MKVVLKVLTFLKNVASNLRVTLVGVRCKRKADLTCYECKKCITCRRGSKYFKTHAIRASESETKIIHRMVNDSEVQGGD